MTLFEYIEKERNNEKNRKYRSFMENPENIRNCDECPDKMDHPNWQMPLPCGQQHCWVELHCKEE